MPRDLPIGNGSMLAAYDFDYQIRDFYYPRVGKENHALGHPWRFGVWLEGEFSWLNRDNWTIERDYVSGALVTSVTASHAHLPLRLHFSDAIDYEKTSWCGGCACKTFPAARWCRACSFTPTSTRWKTRSATRFFSTRRMPASSTTRGRAISS